MQRLGYSLILGLALISWPAVGQEPPGTAKGGLGPPQAPGALLPGPLPPPLPPALPPDRPAEPVLRQDKEEPKKEDAKKEEPKKDGPADAGGGEPGAGPIASSLMLSAPLSEIGQPGDTLFALGGWYVNHSGSTSMVGEYQGLSSSPFFILDGLYSNRYRTLGIYGNMTDNESNQAGLHFFQQNFFTDVDYQRFIHRLGHVPLDNFTPSNAITETTKFPPSSVVLGKDLSPGFDYAIRVEEISSSTGWRVNDNIRVRVDFWQMRKFGHRQENAAAHCFASSASGSSNCHVVSQSQHIDWTTSEVTPRVEATFGVVTLEYSRPMRQYTNNDQMIFRAYNNGSIAVPKSSGGMIWGVYSYADVPQNLTQMDRLKCSINLGPTRQFYAFGYIGRTDNLDRNVDRNFDGYDIRLTDWTLPRTSITLYARRYHQTGQRPGTFAFDGSETQFFTLEKANAEIRTPLEYDRETGGIKGSWRPALRGGILSDIVITAGYEYDYLGRQNAIWQTPFLSSPGLPAGSQEVGRYSQEDTVTQTIFIGAQKPWAADLDSFVRYKMQFINNPLLGFRELSSVLNTNLPDQRHIIEFGGGWHPVSNFSLLLEQDIELGRNFLDNRTLATGNILDFDEQSYATTLTAVYSPTARVSTVASVSIFANWFTQNFFLGDDYQDPDDPIPIGNQKMPLVTQPTFYEGTSELLDFHVIYRVTDRTRVWLGYQFVHGNNQMVMRDPPSFAFPPSLSTSEPKGPISYSDLPRYSTVRVDTNKVTSGIGWLLRPRSTLSLHYDLFHYNDEFDSSRDGIAHQFNANLMCIW